MWQRFSSKLLKLAMHMTRESTEWLYWTRQIRSGASSRSYIYLLILGARCGLGSNPDEDIHTSFPAGSQPTVYLLYAIVPNDDTRHKTRNIETERPNKILQIRVHYTARGRLFFFI